jgi:hypothetical protein
MATLLAGDDRRGSIPRFTALLHAAVRGLVAVKLQPARRADANGAGRAPPEPGAQHLRAAGHRPPPSARTACPGSWTAPLRGWRASFESDQCGEIRTATGRPTSRHLRPWSEMPCPQGAGGLRGRGGRQDPGASGLRCGGRHSPTWGQWVRDPGAGVVGARGRVFRLAGHGLDEGRKRADVAWYRTHQEMSRSCPKLLTAPPAFVDSGEHHA